MTTKPTTPKTPERQRGVMFRLPDSIVVDIGKEAQRLPLKKDQAKAMVRQIVNAYLEAVLLEIGVPKIVKGHFSKLYGDAAVKVEGTIGGEK